MIKTICVSLPLKKLSAFVTAETAEPAALAAELAAPCKLGKLGSSGRPAIYAAVNVTRCAGFAGAGAALEANAANSLTADCMISGGTLWTVTGCCVCVHASQPEPHPSQPPLPQDELSGATWVPVAE